MCVENKRQLLWLMKMKFSRLFEFAKFIAVHVERSKTNFLFIFTSLRIDRSYKRPFFIKRDLAFYFWFKLFFLTLNKI